MKNIKDFRSMNCDGCQCLHVCCCASRCSECYRAEYAEEHYEDLYYAGNGGIACSEKNE